MLEYIKGQIIQSESRLGTLIHIGAGTGSELQEYLDLGFARIALYEAVPELAEQLREISSGFEEISVYQTVIAEKEGKIDFHKMNNPRFSSLREQSALRDYYPNLHSTTVQMEAKGLKDVIGKLKLSDHEINVLILEVQGAEDGLIKSLELGLLQCFSWVIVRALEKRRIDEQMSEYSSALKEAEFMSSVTVDDIFPFCINFFRRDDSAIRLRKVCQEFKAVKIELEKEKSRRGKLEEFEESFKADLPKKEKQITELKEQLLAKSKLNQQFQESLDKVKNEYEQFVSNTEETEEQSKADTLNKEKHINELKEKVETISKVNQQLQEELDKVKNEKEEILYRQEKLDEEVTKAEAQLEMIKDVVIREKSF